MKKLLLLFILLFIPIKINALEVTNLLTNYDFDRVSTMCRSSMCSYKYAKSYEYENGKYKLTGETKIATYDSLKFTGWASERLYTCKSDELDECDELYIVFPYNTGNNNQNALTIMIKNGEELDDIRYHIIGKDYEKVNNKYILKNTSNFDYTNINNINHQHEEIGQFMCLNNETTCDTLYKIDSQSFISVSYYLISTKSDYILSRSYKYIDGKVKLTDIIEHKWPNFNEVEGLYTCLDKTNECKDGLYLIDSYIHSFYSVTQDFNMESFSLPKFYLNKVEFSSETINNKVGKKINSNKYIDNIENVKIIDESIAKIQGNDIIFLKKGETDLVSKDFPSYILYHIIVTEDNNNNNISNSNITNPNTGNIWFFVVMVVISLIIYYIYVVKKINNRNKKMF